MENSNPLSFQNFELGIFENYFKNLTEGNLLYAVEING
jgi:hypothetical protein